MGSMNVTRTCNPDGALSVCAPRPLWTSHVCPDILFTRYQNCLEDITEVQGHLWGISDSLLFLTFQVDSSISCWASGQEAEQSFLPHSSDSPPAGPPEPASALTADHSLPGKVNSYLFETQSALLSLNPVPQLHSQVRAAVGVFPQLRGCDGQDCTHRLCILQAVPRDGVSVVL